MGFLDEDGVAQLWRAMKDRINAKLNKSDVLANYTTTTTGKALDASLGPAIKTKMDLVDTIDTNLSTWNTWKPKIYDFDTYVRDFPSAGRWIKLGALKFAYCYQSGDGPNFSGINTMIRIAGVPFNTVIGGGVYFAAFDLASESTKTHVIQQADGGMINIRPNVVSSKFSDASKPGYFLVWVFGY